jgi:hypothetical protein
MVKNAKRYAPMHSPNWPTIGAGTRAMQRLA